jgi:hypothetical protein
MNESSFHPCWCGFFTCSWLRSYTPPSHYYHMVVWRGGSCKFERANAEQIVMFCLRTCCQALHIDLVVCISASLYKDCYRAQWHFNGKFGSSHTISADNPSSDQGFYVIACEGYYKITVSLNIHTMNFNKSSWKTAWWTKQCCYVQITFIGNGRVCTTDWSINASHLLHSNTLFLSVTGTWYMFLLTIRMTQHGVRISVLRPLRIKISHITWYKNFGLFTSLFEGCTTCMLIILVMKTNKEY